MSATAPPATSTSTATATALAAVAKLRPRLVEAAADAEVAGTLAPATVAALRDARLCRLGWPAAFGGPELGLLGDVAVVEALAEADTAAAWVVTIGSFHGGFVGAYASAVAAERVLGGGRDPLVAGQVAPLGRGRRVEGGLVVSGSWSFASGIDHAAWVLSGVVIDEPDGPPTVAEVVVPITAAVVDEASWDVAGLAATGSKEYRLDDVLVPDGFSFAFPEPVRLRGGTTFDLPIRAQILVLHGAFPLGAASRALDEALAETRPLSTGIVADRGSFRRDLGAWTTRVAAARALVVDVAAQLDDLAATAGAVGPELLAQARAASRHATDVAVDATTWAFRTSGGGGLQRSHPLQRVLRDLLAASQHAFVDEVAYEQLGSVRLDGDGPTA